MKKLLVITSVVALITGLSLQSAQAGLVNNDKGFISVNTNSEAEVAPDTAEIS